MSISRGGGANCWIGHIADICVEFSNYCIL